MLFGRVSSVDPRLERFCPRVHRIDLLVDCVGPGVRMGPRCRPGETRQLLEVDRHELSDMLRLTLSS